MTFEEQFNAIKAKHPGVVLLFAGEDFCELLGEDAELAARTLGLALTTRKSGNSELPMAGFPKHALDLYLRKLIRAGHRVAVCRQWDGKRRAGDIEKVIAETSEDALSGGPER